MKTKTQIGFLKTGFFILSAITLAPSFVHAACSNPAGNEGEVLYNDDETVMQWCDGTDWNGFTKSDATPPANADPCDPANTPSTGDACDDGTVYAGVSPDGSVAMYTTHCDAGMAWNGASCTGSRNLMSWNNSTTNYTNTGFDSTTDGDGNTTSLTNLSDAGSPYHGANYCDSSSLNNHTDWYLPARNELNVLYTNRASIGNFNTATFPERYYWSSSEVIAGVSIAMFEDFSSGAQVSTNKDYNMSVRCTRKGYIRPCLNPVGLPGQIIYNNDDSVLQWCGGGMWHAAGPTLSGDITTGLTGHWEMNDGTGSATATDSSSGGNNGTLTNMDVNADWIPGFLGGALDFDGSNDYVATNLTAGSIDQTLSAWVYPHAYASGSGDWLDVVLQKGQDNIDGALGISLGHGTGYIHIQQHAGTWISCGSTATAPLNQWTHIAGVQDGTNSQFKVYVNGVLDATCATGTTTTNSEPWWIGQHNYGGYEYRFNGAVDDARIYNRVLTDQEIAKLFTATGGGNTPDACATINAPTPGTACDDGTVFAGNHPSTFDPLFVLPADNSAAINWNDGGSDWTTTGAISLTDGAANTATIIAADSNSVSPGTQQHTAAQMCADSTGSGHSDWYMPAQSELSVLYTNQASIGGFNTTGGYPVSWYWSSSEDSDQESKMVRFTDGSTGPTSHKYASHPLRCVRKGYEQNCANPFGSTGNILYNTDYKVPQYCNGTEWVAAGEGLTRAERAAIIVAANPGVFYSSETGNFYKQSASSFNFTNSLSNAAAETLEGANGHLLTITSAEEKTFIDSIRTQDVWVAANDVAVEGEWRWVAGPETGEMFWLGDNTGSVQNSLYNDWGAGQPDNNSNVEDYAGTWVSAGGSWNDFDNSGLSTYYITEWEGEDVF